ncbi:unnamed protein product [Amoebophrya sp. A25]|nr:unnamed protein product [Amoebophrya sp. A25]|eukprot:GSA25T00006667001.1
MMKTRTITKPRSVNVKMRVMTMVTRLPLSRKQRSNDFARRFAKKSRTRSTQQKEVERVVVVVLVVRRTKEMAKVKVLRTQILMRASSATIVTNMDIRRTNAG